jgi:hypothetical protein
MRGQKRVEDARRRAGVPAHPRVRKEMKAWIAGTGLDRPGHDECQTSDSQNYCVEPLILVPGTTDPIHGPVVAM